MCNQYESTNQLFSILLFILSLQNPVCILPLHLSPVKLAAFQVLNSLLCFLATILDSLVLGLQRWIRGSFAPEEFMLR